jgi:hypothetical protein
VPREVSTGNPQIGAAWELSPTKFPDKIGNQHP